MKNKRKETWLKRFLGINEELTDGVVAELSELVAQTYVCLLSGAFVMSLTGFGLSLIYPQLVAYYYPITLVLMLLIFSTWVSFMTFTRVLRGLKGTTIRHFELVMIKQLGRRFIALSMLLLHVFILSIEVFYNAQSMVLMVKNIPYMLSLLVLSGIFYILLKGLVAQAIDQVSPSESSPLLLHPIGQGLLIALTFVLPLVFILMNRLMLFPLVTWAIGNLLMRGQLSAKQLQLWAMLNDLTYLSIPVLAISRQNYITTPATIIVVLILEYRIFHYFYHRSLQKRT